MIRYAVTVTDPDTRKTYRHYHEDEDLALLEVAQATVYGFPARYTKVRSYKAPRSGTDQKASA